MNTKNFILYTLAGVLFGFVLMKAEVVSWFRIQEMFRFEAFHMYGVIGMAVLVGLISLQIIKRLNVKDSEGNPITVAPKDPAQMKRYIIGGTAFGLGWALLGACPGPMFILLGSGLSIMIVPILAGIAGTWFYGAIKHKLPH
ncbi:MAG: YeeE/YedE family protein [Balneolales bacterium]|nr:YeeE/YedE family protein [Balneolales bacterium]